MPYWSLKPEYIVLPPAKRLYGIRNPLVGLTGGIASGKSSVSDDLKSRELFVICADQLVKNIYQTKEAKKYIKDDFPDAWQEHEGEINFKKLRKMAFENPEHKSKLERFIYARLPHQFTTQASQAKEDEVIIYDVPLLFEKGLAELVDLKVTVFAPPEAQIKRLIKRDGVPRGDAENSLKNQMPIHDKKDLSDYIIDNSGSTRALKKNINKFIEKFLIEV